jgi:hypothetical protein
MKMEVIISSEMLIDFHRAEQRYIPQEWTLHDINGGYSHLRER